jgi:integrase
VGELMRRIESLKWSVQSAGLRLLAYTFVRPGELRGATWDEIDLDATTWRIPAERMKMRRPHIVPLARQTVELLRDLRDGLSAGSPYVLHGVRSLLIPINKTMLTKSLRLLGYSPAEMSAHGFRATASTLLNEIGWPPDAIEAQLAHSVGGTVRAVYNHAQYLPVRRVMMQWYADYLDALRDGRPAPPVDKNLKSV